LKSAIDEQSRIKAEFKKAFEQGLVCQSFQRDENNPKYLLY
jgi:hypothetical protein